MSTLGLGIEDAARALTVSKAIQREQTQRGVSPLDAMDQLTAKLSGANLMSVGQGAQPASSMDPCDSMPSRASEVRIQPVLSVAIPPRKRTKSATSGTGPISSRTNTLALKSAKHGNGTRKRSAEDMSTPNQPDLSIHKQEASDDCFQPRPRSDSLTEVANAKLGDKKLPTEEPSSAIRAGTLASPSVVRAKRGRVDDGEQPHNVLKRTRASSDLN